MSHTHMSPVMERSEFSHTLLPLTITVTLIHRCAATYLDLMVDLMILAFAWLGQPEHFSPRLDMCSPYKIDVRRSLSRTQACSHFNAYASVHLSMVYDTKRWAVGRFYQQLKLTGDCDRFDNTVQLCPCYGKTTYVCTCTCRWFPHRQPAMKSCISPCI